ncbi:Torus domain [Trypanosoma vivax]|uniref:C3H1-type domain-containing protein n=1 Tax=Trypanosoma vivax (strain Y486) TaxID=1055687 RepID=G0TS95_TRYVY|nr:hypothetical protein TRVL_09110 [Trypanosoma vivax]KAH8605545.1 Torus domain [Trypanosoma vivax]CCC46821.1 conserved hypothetical protein [Trypanosoma vivax Y486]
MLHRDSGMWNSNTLGGGATAGGGGGTALGNRGATGIGGSTSVSAATTNNNSYAFLTATSPPVLLPGSTNGMSSTPATQVPATVPHERSQELCRFFVNGGCIRGENCQFLHQLPDERHLDVNGYGYILNPNVHNAQKTLPLAVSNNPTSATQVNSGATSNSPLMLGLSANNGRQSHSAKNKPQTSLMVGAPTNLPFQIPTQVVKAPPPKYRPPEPFLEYNLPPTLALPLKTPSEEVAAQLTRTMLQSGL